MAYSVVTLVVILWCVDIYKVEGDGVMDVSQWSWPAIMAVWPNILLLVVGMFAFMFGVWLLMRDDTMNDWNELFNHFGEATKKECFYVLFLFGCGVLMLIWGEYAKDYQTYTDRVVSGFILWLLSLIVGLLIAIKNLALRIIKLEGEVK